MFNGLFSSIFGKSKENNNLKSDESENNNLQPSDAHNTKRGFNEENVRVILLEEDKDWLFVEREEDNVEECVADKKATKNNLQLVPFKSILSHLSAVKENDENCLLSANLPLSLYPNTMDESWFLTPPSCFSSASIQLEASPLENLLIEHPSMSVYHRRRRSLADVNNDELEDLVVLEFSQDADNNYAVSLSFLLTQIRRHFPTNFNLNNLNKYISYRRQLLQEVSAIEAKMPRNLALMEPKEALHWFWSLSPQHHQLLQHQKPKRKPSL